MISSIRKYFYMVCVWLFMKKHRRYKTIKDTGQLNKIYKLDKTGNQTKHQYIDTRTINKINNNLDVLSKRLWQILEGIDSTSQWDWFRLEQSSND